MFFLAVHQFLEYLRVVKNASEHTLRNYTIDLNSLKTYHERELFEGYSSENLPEKIQHDENYQKRIKHHDHLFELNKIDRRTIRGFLAHLNATQHSKKTIVRRLSSLRTFFKFAFLNKFIAINPAEDLDTPKIEKKIPHPLSYEQVLKLFQQPDLTNYLGLRDRAIIELFYSSGLRVSELVAMNRSDFDSTSLLIRLKGKGKKERVIPITKHAANWISTYLSHPERHIEMDGHLPEVDKEAIFLNKLGSRLTARSVDRNFDKYLKASGLAGKITPHTIRHTIATHWLDSGMDLKIIQQLLGHTSLATTTIYTQVSLDLKKKVYDKAHPRA